MTGLKVGKMTYVQIFGRLAPQKFGRAKNSKILPNFRQLSSLSMNILENERDIKNRKQT